jgi:hypothetical protein
MNWGLSEMGWLELGLIGSIVFAVYYFQQIKITLKEKGYHVDFFTGWVADYRSFKSLVVSETNEESRVEYQGILNGLHMALVGLGIIAILFVLGV